ncbi:MAG: kelch repeat-containing protein [Promethearchaeota archaeon]
MVNGSGKKYIAIFIGLIMGGTSLGILGSFYVSTFFPNDYSYIEWMWISGSNTVNLNGVYGLKGVPSANNYPGSRKGAVSWTDSNDNLWLFGGYGYPETGEQGYLNDLWKYDGVNWTWMSGSKIADVNGVYGSKGVSDSSNCPGGREGAVSWTDSDDNLWLFGGRSERYTVDFLNDLWRYDGVNWTWMSGSTLCGVSGVYGTRGVPNSLNCPGGREYAISWTDSDDNLWLFGGNGRPEYGHSLWLNDLWRYDGVNWTWMSGSKITDVNGVYGTRGVPDSLNYPGGRENAVSWTDSDDNLWLFGGYGCPEYGDWGYLNDLWKYDGVNWTWMSGSKSCGVSGVHGTKGIPNIANFPGCRKNSISWTDSDDNLWLFGGWQSLDQRCWGHLSDLWKYDGVNWTWMSGKKTNGVYGIYGMKGIPNTETHPGGRESAISWTDSDDNLWLFGGYGCPEYGDWGYLNDLWKCDPYIIND